MPINLRYFLAKTLGLRLLSLALIIVFIVCISKIKKSHHDKVVADIPTSALKFILYESEQHIKPMDKNRISELMSKYNLDERIVNSDIYGPLKKDTTILVILVDKISISFKILLVSLSQIRGIEDALVIFSHSYFDENINSLIRSIDFCRVLQIFYPYSIQTHPQEFPGFHPDDCPYDIKMNIAEAINCTGAFHPDINGRYRNPLQAERKHHWWWTANKVFENLTCTTNHKGLVIFLEGYYFFMEDFIYMALYMKNLAQLLPQCEFVSLGIAETRSGLHLSEKSTFSVEIATWNPRHHSNVLAFDVSVWNSIIAHYDEFCAIDDSSWFLSLYYVSLNRKDGKRFRTIASVMPRIFDINSCGFHRMLNDCDVMKNIFLLMNLQKQNYENLFPSHLELYINVELEIDEFVIFDYEENNGGWNDPRDIEMCHNMTANKIKNILLHMNNEFNNYIADE